MELNEIFHEIRAYHKQLGYDYFNWRDDRMQDWRNNSLALMMEVAELADSMPWKPWRKTEDQPEDKENAVVEIADCIFFLGALLEILEVSGEELEMIFLTKLKENYDRIDRGYSKKGGDVDGR